MGAFKLPAATTKTPRRYSLREVARALGVKDWSTVPLAVRLLRIPVKRKGRAITIDVKGYRRLDRELTRCGLTARSESHWRIATGRNRLNA